MTSWTVWYDSWQMECCGEPFAVGDEVALPLMIRPREGPPGAGLDPEHGRVSTVAGPVRTVGQGGDRYAVLRADGRLDMALTGGYRTPPPRIEVTGTIRVELHTGQWPKGVGRVTAVEILSRRYAPVPGDGRTYEAVPGEWALRAERSIPKWFRNEERLREDGAFVTLEVPDGDPGEGLDAVPSDRSGGHRGQ